MVLPGLTADEVYILSQDDQGNVEAEQSSLSPALLTGSELFSAFFEIQKLYTVIKSCFNGAPEIGEDSRRVNLRHRASSEGTCHPHSGFGRL